MGKTDKRRGFTLVELIISVGTLALGGILVIQLFLSAKDITRRTEELDHSVYLSNYIIEAAKAGLWEEVPLIEFQRVDTEAGNNGIILLAFYDKDWNTVGEGSREALFQVTLLLAGQEGFGMDSTLYGISLQIHRLKPYFRGKEEKPLLHSLDTEIYVDTIKEALLQ